MKKSLLILALVLASVTVFSQESIVTLSGGYAFANLEDVETDATGFRINGLYEFNPNEGALAHGFSIGYIGTKAEFTTGAQTAEYKLNNWPVYYAPKVMLGSDKIKGFIKGALGMHFSSYKHTGALGEVKSNDTGFYGGASLGAILRVKGQMFLNVEYEWAYLSNSFYRDGFMNTVMLGIGMKF